MRLHTGPDRFRCHRCLVFWEPAAHAETVIRGGQVVCADRYACNDRIRAVQALDRMVRAARRNAS